MLPIRKWTFHRATFIHRARRTRYPHLSRRPFRLVGISGIPALHHRSNHLTIAPWPKALRRRPLCQSPGGGRCRMCKRSLMMNAMKISTCLKIWTTISMIVYVSYSLLRLVPKKIGRVFKLMRAAQLGDDHQCPHRDNSRSQSSVQLSMNSGFDYDTTDGFFSDGELSVSPRSKKRRAVDPPTGFATRFENKFPSFSRKWRSRKPYEAPSILRSSAELPSDIPTSGNGSNRSSSLSDSKQYDYQMPPTPTKSNFGSRESLAPSTPIDIEKANRSSAEVEENLAITPLLPPLMIDASANAKQASVHSPLQSPTVAETSDTFSGAITPIDSITTPQLFGIPSPPLSTKPSISSFHRVALSRPSHLIPSSDIPGIKIGDPVDEWSHKLGHANFNIHPEPYLPESFDLEACRQLRANWDLARCNYTKHLVRTGEHYGVTSNTYKHTQDKWAATEIKWKNNNDITIANTVENSSDPFATLKHTTLGDAGSNQIMSKLPSLNDTRSAGKFPLLGDEDIVGPMVQAASQLQRSPNKKAKLYKFFAEKFPLGLSGKS